MSCTTCKCRLSKMPPSSLSKKAHKASSLILPPRCFRSVSLACAYTCLSCVDSSMLESITGQTHAYLPSAASDASGSISRISGSVSASLRFCKRRRTKMRHEPKGAKSLVHTHDMPSRSQQTRTSPWLRSRNSRNSLAIQQARSVCLPLNRSRKLFAMASSTLRSRRYECAAA